MPVVQPRTTDKITLAFAHMKRAAPAAWAELEIELNALLNQRATEVMNAPADRIFVAQGKAQQLHELVKLATSCIADAQQLEERLRKATIKERT